MTRILVVGEDGLCCALGERLVREALPNWALSKESIDAGGITKLIPSLGRYAQQAQYVQPVLCVADTDGKCAVTLRTNWLPVGAPAAFILRLAVSEAESWLLADRLAIAQFFGIAPSNVSNDPDLLQDAKLEMLRLARRSSGTLRREMVSDVNLQRPGTGYNMHLRRFTLNYWRPSEAQTRSESLARALASVARLGVVPQ